MSTRMAQPIRRTVIVQCSAERAFNLFTEGMGTWWPLEGYSRAVSEFASDGVTATELEFQPRLGGSILEHVSDGRTLPWAEVVEWRPPELVVVAWRPHDRPEPPTELAVTFTAIEGAGTAVELEHRGWERLSEDFLEEMYGIYVRGWLSTLEIFAAAANAPASL